MAVAVNSIEVIESGIVDYETSLLQQRVIHEGVANGTRNNTLIFVEHPSVYTAGRRTDKSEMPVDGTPVVEVDRGGRITWHGPGQLVGYPIVRLAKRNEMVGFVRVLEDAIIETLSEFNLRGQQIIGKTGVWIVDASSARKIAAIGIRVAKGVTMHGFALNVNPDLTNFKNIVACGLPDVITTSMAQELNEDLQIAQVLPVLEKAMTNSLGKVSI